MVLNYILRGFCMHLPLTLWHVCMYVIYLMNQPIWMRVTNTVLVRCTQSARSVQDIEDEMNGLIGSAGAVSIQSHHNHLPCHYQIILHQLDLDLFDKVIEVANQMQLVASPDFVMVGFAPAENISWPLHSPFGLNIPPNFHHCNENANTTRIGRYMV